MRHNHTAPIQHAGHYSFDDLKRFLASHIEIFDNLLEKTMETGILIVLAGFIYMVILAIATLNHANLAYFHGISCLACNSVQIIYDALQGFI